MIICYHCKKEIEPEITEQVEIYGVIQIWKCPKCHSFLRSKTGKMNKKDDIESVGEIVKRNYNIF